MRIQHALAWAGFAAAVALGCEAVAQTATVFKQAALDVNSLPMGLSSSLPNLEEPRRPEASEPLDGSPLAPPRGAREPRGNPLWAIPLELLSASRERPIFLPSRRPPAPIVARSAPAPQPVASPQ